MKEEKIYMAIWKGSFLLGNLLLILFILSGWITVYGIAGILILAIPYICMMATNIEKRKR